MTIVKKIENPHTNQEFRPDLFPLILKKNQNPATLPSFVEQRAQKSMLGGLSCLNPMTHGQIIDWPQRDNIKHFILTHSYLWQKTYYVVMPAHYGLRCLCLGLHLTRLPLCGKELGIRKSHPPLTSRESWAIPPNLLYYDCPVPVPLFPPYVPSHSLWVTLHDWESYSGNLAIESLINGWNALIQLDCLCVTSRQNINLPANQKGYDTFETSVGKLSARRIQICRVYFCLGIILKVIFWITFKIMPKQK